MMRFSLQAFSLLALMALSPDAQGEDSVPFFIEPMTPATRSTLCGPLPEVDPSTDEKPPEHNCVIRATKTFDNGIVIRVSHRPRGYRSADSTDGSYIVSVEDPKSGHWTAGAVEFMSDQGMGHYIMVESVTPIIERVSVPGHERLQVLVTFVADMKFEVHVEEQDEPMESSKYQELEFVTCGPNDAGVWRCGQTRFGRHGMFGPSTRCRVWNHLGLHLATACEVSRTVSHYLQIPLPLDDMTLAYNKYLEDAPLRRVHDAGGFCKYNLDRADKISREIGKLAADGNAWLVDEQVRERASARESACKSAEELRHAIRIYESRGLPEAANAIKQGNSRCLQTCPAPE